MAKTETGIALTIKAFLPLSKNLDQQVETLQAVQEAHRTGDYSKLLTMAKVDAVKAEQRTRRMDVLGGEPGEQASGTP